MQKILFKTLVLIIPSLIFSQKKEYYFDINNSRITKKEYKNIKDNRFEYLKLTFISDTAKIYAVEKRETEGLLSADSYKKLIFYLNSITEKKTDSTKTIVVNYYPGLDKFTETANKFYLNDLFKSFIEEIDSKKNVTQYFIYKSPEGTEFYEKQIKWYLDKNRFIERNFFPRHYPCGSYLIVYPNGKYYLYKGEYYINEILKKI